MTLWLVLSSSAAVAERLAVVSKIANVRSGPGTKYDILWKVEKYYPLQIIKKKGLWYYFQDFEKDEGWIHKSLVGNIRSIITKKEQCNLRAGPGTNFEILFTVEKGIPFKVIKQKGRWLYVQHSDGDKGWIYKYLVW